MIPDKARTASRTEPYVPPRNLPEPHILDFLLLVARHRWMVLTLILLFGIGSFVLTIYVPYTYEATATLLPPDKSSSAGLLDRFKATGALKLLKETENPSVDLLQNILESRTVYAWVAQDSVVRAFWSRQVGPTSDAETTAEWVRSSLMVIPHVAQLEVHCVVSTKWNSTDADKHEATVVSARMANLAVARMMDYFQRSIRRTAHQSRLYVDAELQARMHEQDSLDAAYEAYQNAHGVVALPEQQAKLIQGYAALEASAAEAEMNERILLQKQTENSELVRDAAAKVAAAHEAAADFAARNSFSPEFQQLPEAQRIAAQYTLRIKGLDPIIVFLRQEAEQELVNETRDIDVIQPLDSALPPTRKLAPKRLSMTLLGFTVGAGLSIFYIVIATFLGTLRKELNHKDELEEAYELKEAIA